MGRRKTKRKKGGAAQQARKKTEAVMISSKGRDIGSHRLFEELCLCTEISQRFSITQELIWFTPWKGWGGLAGGLQLFLKPAA